MSGAGFIGSTFVRLALAQSDARVVVIDKLTYAGNFLSLSDMLNNPQFAFVNELAFPITRRSL
jgi:dTDP-glucose 4,6-dehydratase